jgi:hypothetical protein
MVETDIAATGFQVSFKAFGVPIRVTVPTPDFVRRLQENLPPGSARHEPSEEDHQFHLVSPDGVSLRIEQGYKAISGSCDADVALEVLDSKIRETIALNAAEHVFVHAGVVGYRGRAIVIPGRTFTGKTTLVSELVRVGADYYSDEFAPLGADGRVHPYPKPLSIRGGDGSWSQTDRPVSEIGGRVGADPLPVGVVAIAPYAPGTVWNPTRLSAGEGVLAVLANTVPAQERPVEAMTAIRAAVADAVVLEGERGEAVEAGARLLELVSANMGAASVNGTG